jgi:hypothetical protein
MTKPDNQVFVRLVFAPKVIAEERLEQSGKRGFKSLSGLLPTHFGAAYGG